MSKRPGPVASLTTAQIARAAVEVADAHGLAGLTMRRLADRLGVSAAGLYRYVDSREALLDVAVDALVGEIRHPAPSGDWVGDLLLVAQQQRDLYAAHQWLAEAVSAVRRLGPRSLDHFDWGLAVLGPVDAPAVTKMEVLALLNGLASLFAGATRAGTGPEVLSRIVPAQHPHLVAALGSAATATGREDLFERALTSLLTGMLGVRSSTPDRT